MSSVTLMPHCGQNGGAPNAFQEEDPIKRYIRNGRDLARLVFTDTIYRSASCRVLAYEATFEGLGLRWMSLRGPLLARVSGTTQTTPGPFNCDVAGVKAGEAYPTFQAKKTCCISISQDIT